MKLEEKLISLRKEKGLSQMKLAEMMNVSRQAISRWEVGAAVPSTDNLKSLSKLYHVPVDYLLHDEVERDSFNKDEGSKQKAEHYKYGRIIFCAIVIVIISVLFHLVNSNRTSKDLDINNIESEVLDGVKTDQFSISW
mgnify:CR=1 FL=1